MTEDLHSATVYQDEVFKRFMDGALPGWRDLPFEEKRMFAKRWNFHRLYAVGDPDAIARVLMFSKKETT